MTTKWTTPNTVTQYAEVGAEDAHISWENIDNFSSIKRLNGQFIKTSKDLMHIARDPRHDLLDKTYYLKCTNFIFDSLPNTITGIEARLTMNRFGRITDDTIQLCFQDDVIGDNQATLDLNPAKIYGDQNSLWNSNLTTANLQSSTFGIILRFKSHPSWPHKCSALIDAIEIRIH